MRAIPGEVSHKLEVLRPMLSFDCVAANIYYLHIDPILHLYYLLLSFGACWLLALTLTPYLVLVPILILIPGSTWYIMYLYLVPGSLPFFEFFFFSCFFFS